MKDLEREPGQRLDNVKTKERDYAVTTYIKNNRWNIPLSASSTGGFGWAIQAALVKV
jgi:hypothetical protein